MERYGANCYDVAIEEGGGGGEVILVFSQSPR